MLTFEIARWEPKQKEKKHKHKFVHGSREHMEFILNRSITHADLSEKFEPGDTYFVNGIKKQGMILCLVDDFDKVEWEGLKPKFIEMYFNDGEITQLYHPSDLRKR